MAEEGPSPKDSALHLHFFHWHLEFPEVFEKGGFDVILGNPPWEKIKLEEEEHWIDDPYICNARNKAERARRIKEYRESSDPVKRVRVVLFDRAKHSAEAASKFARKSGRFPLTATGDINTYALFAELDSQITNQKGRLGVVIPTGIATDDTTKEFFASLTSKQGLVSLFDFENKELLFPDVAPVQKFCLFTFSNTAQQTSDFAFFLTRLEHLQDGRRRFSLAASDLALLNPNTRTCPVFRTGVDAQLTTKLYR